MMKTAIFLLFGLAVASAASFDELYNLEFLDEGEKPEGPLPTEGETTTKQTVPETTPLPPTAEPKPPVTPVEPTEPEPQTTASQPPQPETTVPPQPKPETTEAPPKPRPTRKTHRQICLERNTKCVAEFQCLYLCRECFIFCLDHIRSPCIRPTVERCENQYALCWKTTSWYKKLKCYTEYRSCKNYAEKVAHKCRVESRK